MSGSVCGNCCSAPAQPMRCSACSGRGVLPGPRGAVTCARCGGTCEEPAPLSQARRDELAEQERVWRAVLRASGVGVDDAEGEVRC